ncbi:TetR family transcriptional regulator [Oleiphilus sp. HI0009]|uniref:TetR/AcrR family transcriptional regulator n=1 Tax=unclassified Oleiphilus TaxID=2631174 RepID=UPI0007C2E43C|nr:MULTISPECIES: TetR/AcrR family transcriptional regulator [unclassified Oleiphilus]KZX86003.1 TetR family transcriptional regulator [Oleiphilus sp. HI0009]MCH2160114.1 TetR/AcrR family transcriptional regulator [Oleiphilaceae bacterium]KZY65626.1 TetR family transcriptional regulator [Oleiphilus sp. HI0066]KZY69339.1 TetR family transcriptional regulator [Oleiphilus sp. HI0066]KZY74188.1 TetR family transcriptional regulator [Oleiphilus sp. HI0067]
MASKTKERIILESLDLFNAQGERNVSTNHIAAHLNMSPGNLYYHFRNKSDIIYQIFKNYELMVDTYLRVPEGRKIKVEDLLSYLDAVFNGLWAYRFLHRDLEHLLDNDDKLREDYRAFTLRCVRGVMSIIEALELSEIFSRQTEQQRQSKALNVWLIVTNWMTFLKTMHGTQEDRESNPKAIQHGVYQVLDFIVPHLREPEQAELAKLQEGYCFDEVLPGV